MRDGEWIAVLAVQQHVPPGPTQPGTCNPMEKSHVMHEAKLKTLALTTVLLAVLVLSGQSALADRPKLILQTTPDPVEIPLQGTVVIDPETGDLRATPVDPQACQATTQDCGDVNVALQTFSVNNVAAVTGSVPVVELSQGSNAVFRWNSRGAWECEGLGMPGWSASGKPPANTIGQTVSTNNVQVGEYDAAIECRNGPVVSTAGPIRVSVLAGTDPSGPTQCGAPERQAPSGWTQLTTGNLSCVWRAGVGFDGSRDCSTWEGIFRQSFPDGGGNPQRFGIGRQSPNEYLAIKFSTGDFGPTQLADIAHEGPGSGVTVTPRIATISECSGNFDRDSILAETGCYFVLTQLIDRIRIGGTQTTRACKLESNKDYYLNIVHSSSPAGTPVGQLQSNCPQNTFCGVLYAPN